jgi:hypothetical protein
MVAALASRELGRPINRKRVQRVMRAQRLLQPTRSGIGVGAGLGSSGSRVQMSCGMWT